MLNEFFNGGGADDSYTVERSLRINSADSASLSRTPSVAGDRTTWTWSAWIKRCKFGVNQRVFTGISGSGSNDNYMSFLFDTDDTFRIGLWTLYSRVSNAVFRDPSAWYHFTVAADLDNPDDALKLRAYVNGSEISWANTSTNPSTSGINGSGIQSLGADTNGTSDPCDIYLADVQMVDGQALSPDAFGYFDDIGVWQPKTAEVGETYVTSQITSATTLTRFNRTTAWSSSPNGNMEGFSNLFSGDNISYTAIANGEKGTFSWNASDLGTFSTFEMYVTKANERGSTFKINDVDYHDDIVLNAWNSFPITSFYAFESQSLGSEKKYRIHAIRVDGYILNDTTPDGGVTGQELTFADSQNLDQFTVGTELSGAGTVTEQDVAGNSLTLDTASMSTGQTLALGGYGLTGFHLDFADNSSDANLGLDVSGVGNNWTPVNLTANAIDYVASTGGEVPYSGTWDLMFNGVLTGGPYVYNQTSSVTFSVPLTGVIEILTDLPGTYQGNPTTYTLSTGASISKSTTSQEWINFGQQTNVTSLTVNGPDPGAYLSAIRVDGTVLVSQDPSGTDSLIDSSTNYESKSGGNNGGNYCTLNPLDKNTNANLSNGNLDFEDGASNHGVRSTFFLSSGKWYWEVAHASGTGSGNFTAGIAKADWDLTYVNGTNSFGYGSQGTFYPSTSATATVASKGDVVGFAFDADAGTLEVYVNGTSLGTASDANWGNIEDGPWSPAFGTGAGKTCSVNFGQRPFQYAPPTGYVSVCAENLSESAYASIADGSTAFDIAAWTGDATSNTSRTISLPGDLNPDLVWIKRRSSSFNHLLNDSVRGFTVNRGLNSNTTDPQGSTNSDYTYGFVSGTGDGEFTVASGIADSYANKLNETHVAWCWDAASSNTTVATDANGSGLPGAECVYRANTAAGFSIVRVDTPTTTEARVHGLNQKPDLIICKSTGSADSWHTYHSSLGYTKYINLNTTGPAVESDQFGSQEPTSTYFYVKPATGSGANKSGGMIYYIWHSVPGYSAFGSYVGNGSTTESPFIWTGFRVAWLMIKSATTGGELWTIHDSTRDVDNIADHRLVANSSDAETTGTSPRYKDLLSNGFKIRGASGDHNTSGDLYIYAAFAEHPLRHARAR